MVDVYNSSVDNKAVIIQGVVEFIEKRREFQKLYDIFYEKFDWVREDPWKEGEALCKNKTASQDKLGILKYTHMR